MKRPLIWKAWQERPIMLKKRKKRNLQIYDNKTHTKILTYFLTEPSSYKFKYFWCTHILTRCNYG